MFESLDRFPVCVYEHFQPESEETALGPVLERTRQVGPDRVYTTVVRLAEIKDRRLSYHLTAGAFVLAICGISLSGGVPERPVPSVLVGLAGAFGAVGFFFALRGTTREVEQHAELVRTLATRDIKAAWIAMRRKSAYTWLATRVLGLAAVFLGLAFVLDGLAA